ncbi:MAG: DUF2088 domain-containing protein [Gemmatimonadetes bacterium]|jgi:hypothetical protein|nr:DUF2088 domain-containing protein [Gemmatimonadota bacterium]
MPFPSMARFRQRFEVNSIGNVAGAVREQLAAAGLKEAIAPGARIAVTGGSRGIDEIDLITRTVIDCIRECGGKPFVLPAMGSHGGATAEGQKEVLSSYGISQESMGVPVEATMEVVEVDTLDDGTPVFVNRLALEADGIVLVNRVKPHTSFRGPHESGLMKILTIGLGCHRGATLAHSQGAQGLTRMVPGIARAMMKKTRVVMGVAIIENAYEKTARIACMPGVEIEQREPELLAEARQAMPRLMVQGIDLLIVDEMGKDISGTGMDTNVIGRMMLPGVKEPEKPGVSRIVVLDLSERTHGNANGVGLADIVTRRLFERIDFKATYANAFTSTFLNRAYIPVVMETDREAVAAVLDLLRMENPAEARVARITNTLKLERIQISEALVREFGGHPDLEQESDLETMAFSDAGTLL